MVICKLLLVPQSPRKEKHKDFTGLDTQNSLNQEWNFEVKAQRARNGDAYNSNKTSFGFCSPLFGLQLRFARAEDSRDA
eukprot:1931279-Amphidinium_carterae.1